MMWLLISSAMAGTTLSFEVAPTVSTHAWKLEDGTKVRHPLHYVNVGEVTGIVNGFTVEAETSGLWQLVRVLATGSGPDGTSKSSPGWHGYYATLMTLSIGNAPIEAGPTQIGWRFAPLHVAGWALYEGEDNWSDYAAYQGALGLPIGPQVLWEPREEELFTRLSVQGVPWFNMQQSDGMFAGWSIKTDVDVVWEATRFIYVVGNVQSEIFPTMSNDLDNLSTDQPNKARHTQAGLGVAIPLEWTFD